MDMAQTPPQGQMAEAPAQGGMTICINVAPGGSITVSKEAYEAAEGTEIGRASCRERVSSPV